MEKSLCSGRKQANAELANCSADFRVLCRVWLTCQQVCSYMIIRGTPVSQVLQFLFKMGLFKRLCKQDHTTVWQITERRQNHPLLFYSGILTFCLTLPMASSSAAILLLWIHVLLQDKASTLCPTFLLQHLYSSVHFKPSLVCPLSRLHPGSCVCHTVQSSSKMLSDFPRALTCSALKRKQPSLLRCCPLPHNRCWRSWTEQTSASSRLCCKSYPTAPSDSFRKLEWRQEILFFVSDSKPLTHFSPHITKKKARLSDFQLV